MLGVMKVYEMRVLLILGSLLFIVVPAHAQDRAVRQASERPAPTSDRPPVGNGLVLSHVTVLTKAGGSVTGLGKDAFSILDNKQPREITYFSHEDEPLSIAVLFDLSGSMLGGPLSNYDRTRVTMMREHFSQFIQASHPANEYFVIGFNHQVQLIAEGVQGDKALSAISTLLSSNKPKGMTAFYDACYFGLEKVKQGKYLKHAVLVFSDGQDTASKRKLNDLSRLLKENAVMFFSIDIEGLGSWSARESQDLLVELAVTTGGQAFSPGKAKELIAVLNILAFTLRNQYTVGFISESSAKGDKWRRLKVEVRVPPRSPVKQKDVFVLGREGYYSAQ